MYAAQKEIAKRVGARHDYDVSVYAATRNRTAGSRIEHEKTQRKETPYIEDGGKTLVNPKLPSKLRPWRHVQQQTLKKRRLSRVR